MKTTVNCGQCGESLDIEVDLRTSPGANEGNVTHVDIEATPADGELARILAEHQCTVEARTWYPGDSGENPGEPIPIEVR